MVGNLVLLAIAMMAPSALFWVLLQVPRTVEAVGSCLRERRRGPTATCPPIEQLAADLRRVHRTIQEFPPGTSMVRRTAATQAYDTLLMQVCRAVEVPHRLDSVADGTDREFERLRVEVALTDAGIRVS